ncbi:hypothetical protein [Meiothermus ruber]|uniref:hypothetical protein n=1 Tax=Meiothermus ruber TaxID=277 RepID=UPI0007231487|nr:hypothetical protein [Meiothermus ruber]MCL6530157.1 hypothetical protein [Meiothermus ruber]GAO74043.1 putative uncharacterized protein [Meiothermus ruber H328]
MKIKELSVRETAGMFGGAPGDGCVGVGLRICYDKDGNSTLKIDLPFWQHEFSLQTRQDKIDVHNENQWARGEFIRKYMDDGGEAYNKNTAVPGTWWGER